MALFLPNIVDFAIPASALSLAAYILQWPKPLTSLDSLFYGPVALLSYWMVLVASHQWELAAEPEHYLAVTVTEVLRSIGLLCNHYFGSMWALVDVNILDLDLRYPEIVTLVILVICLFKLHKQEPAAVVIAMESQKSSPTAPEERRKRELAQWRASMAPPASEAPQPTPSPPATRSLPDDASTEPGAAHVAQDPAMNFNPARPSMQPQSKPRNFITDHGLPYLPPASSARQARSAARPDASTIQAYNSTALNEALSLALGVENRDHLDMAIVNTPEFRAAYQVAKAAEMEKRIALRLLEEEQQKQVQMVADLRSELEGTLVLEIKIFLQHPSTVRELRKLRYDTILTAYHHLIVGKAATLREKASGPAVEQLDTLVTEMEAWAAKVVDLKTQLDKEDPEIVKESPNSLTRASSLVIVKPYMRRAHDLLTATDAAASKARIKAASHADGAAAPKDLRHFIIRPYMRRGHDLSTATDAAASKARIKAASHVDGAAAPKDLRPFIIRPYMRRGHDLSTATDAAASKARIKAASRVDGATGPKDLRPFIIRPYMRRGHDLSTATDAAASKATDTGKDSDGNPDEATLVGFAKYTNDEPVVESTLLDGGGGS